MESTPLDVSQAGSMFAEMFSESAEVVDEKETPQEAEAITAEPIESEEVEQSEPGSEVSDEQPELITIKVDGKEVQVTLDELKNGYQRQADYTRKTMEVSEQRKAAEAETQKAQQERAQYAQQLQHQQIVLANALQEQQQTNWQQLIDTDPVEYLKQHHLFNERQAALQQTHQQMSLINQQQAAEQEQVAQKFIADQQEQLLAKIPEWKDEAKAKQGKNEVRDFLLEQFTAEEVGAVADHRLVLLARDAMLYRKVMANAKAAAKKVENVPQKIQRAGTGANQSIDKRTAAYQSLSKSGSIEDAGRLFATIL